jgi:hypothetical protein
MSAREGDQTRDRRIEAFEADRAGRQLVPAVGWDAMKKFRQRGGARGIDGRGEGGYRYGARGAGVDGCGGGA